MDNIELEITDSALHAIAKKAISRNTGARGLRSIIEDILVDIMYEIPSDQNVEKVILNEQVIDKKIDPIKIYKSDSKATNS